MLRADMRRSVLLGGAVFLGAMALVAAVFLIARNERAFELARWETRLRASGVQPLNAVEQWLDESRAGLRAVAVNPTVQIYLSGAAAGVPSPLSAPESAAQSAFVASYVASLGGRGAFAAQPASGSAESDSGLAVLDIAGHTVAATYGYRPSPRRIAELIAHLHGGTAGPLPSRGGLIGFLAAVRPLQGNESAPAVGYVIGERALGKAFWTSDGSVLATDHGHESLVAAGSGAPLLIGASLPQTRNASASGEFRAALTPLHLQRSPDLLGQDALHFGIPVKGTDWVLVESVPAADALAGVETQIRNLLVILLLSLLAIILGSLALWRHVSGAQQIAAREESLRLYRNVASLLLEAIDQRDPGMAEHSRRVADLSRKVALALGASVAEADRAELAGALMNVGKLFVPVELLGKSSALEKTESLRFAEGSERWLSLLAHAPFEPPLEPVLRDGYRLTRGEAVSSPSRDTYIVVAANMAVALMSPRAYRMAYSPAETLKMLADSRPSIPAGIIAALGRALTG
jgi:hypothetical protein